ncbi:hypothetical protein AB0B45_46630 [Nonomuraea sp. NPDC049152]|uniref:hypothetical protein n=1 Tax=Nonomuraea sp. NPDC049152 TaxID=3154350 RepID=UPI0033D10DD6
MIAYFGSWCQREKIADVRQRPTVHPDSQQQRETSAARLRTLGNVGIGAGIALAGVAASTSTSLAGVLIFLVVALIGFGLRIEAVLRERR